MKKPSAYTISPVTENTVTIHIGNSIDTKTNQEVFRLYNQLVKYRHPSWLDIIPAYSTISIVYDVISIRNFTSSAFDWIRKEIDIILQESQTTEIEPTRLINIPVCYDAEFALDAKIAISKCKIEWPEFVKIHTAQTYRVFMIGFLPGFAYMGTVSKKIVLPRLQKPRIQVPIGSIGIAGEQTGIYPLQSPGGWNIIGRTPLRIFDVKNPNPILLQPADEIKFISITKSEFDSFDPLTFNPVLS